MARYRKQRFDALGCSTKRPIASRDMDRHSARRKTPFTSAARISARCHPNVYRSFDRRPVSLMAYRATTRLITSFSMWKLSATSASEPTAYPRCMRALQSVDPKAFHHDNDIPTLSSVRRNMTSMTRRMMMRAERESTTMAVGG
jgi:hypothetical protein